MGIKQETCYMCDDIATTKEHVPPKCFFPENKDIKDKTKDYRVGLITVPSCSRHNNERSIDDEYLLSLLSVNISSSDIGITQFFTKVQRAWERKPAFQQGVMGTLKPTLTPAKFGVINEETGAIKIDKKRVLRTLEHYAKGLFYHEYRERFLGELKVVPLFLVSENEVRTAGVIGLNQLLSQAYEPVICKGENPEVFNYSFIQWALDGKECFVLRMEFYQGPKVLVFFNRSK